MGFFSQECERCHKSILSPYSISQTNAWMSVVVVLYPDNNIFKGIYDGYGRVEINGGKTIVEDAVGWDNQVWHAACWELDGKPTTYTHASQAAADQGYFYNEEDYDIPDPRP